MENKDKIIEYLNENELITKEVIEIILNYSKEIK